MIIVTEIVLLERARNSIDFCRWSFCHLWGDNISTFDKPFKDYTQQIDLLKNRGLIINNELIALNLLETIGYYPLINGYSNPFVYFDNEGEERFKVSTTIEDIYIQYIIDNEIQNILFPIIIRIENHLKSTLGYIVSDHMGVNDKDTNDNNNIDISQLSYLDKSHYQNNVKTKKILREIKKTSLITTANPTAYYRNEKNHIPPWILFRNIFLWQANSLYRGLKPNLKDAVCSNFILKNTASNRDLKIKMFSDSFEMLREFRNCMAHGSRVYAFKSKAVLSFKGIEVFLGPKIVTTSEYKNDIGKKDLYALFLSILLLTPSSMHRAEFISKLELFDKHYKKIDVDNTTQSYSIFIKESNVPSNFIERLKNAHSYLKTI